MAGGEGPDSGVASDCDSPDVSDRKTMARGALWKQPYSGDSPLGRGAEARSVRCWLCMQEQSDMARVHQVMGLARSVIFDHWRAKLPLRSSGFG